MKKGTLHKLKEELSYEILILPMMIGYTIFFILPVLYSFFASFTDMNRLSQTVNFVGIKNYIDLFSDYEIVTGLKNSFIFAIGMLIFQNLLAIPFAVVLNRQLKLKNFLRAAIFTPAVLSMLIVGFLWNYMMASTDYALLNRLIGMIGIQPINWLGDHKIAMFSIIITQIWQWTGWAMVIYIANLQSIPEELYEAAKIDGATGLQLFSKITLPLLNPGVTVNLVTGLIGGLKVFDIVFSLTGGGPGNATQTIITVLIKRGFNEGFYGYASAYSFVFLIIVLVLTSILMKFLKKWEDSVAS